MYVCVSVQVQVGRVALVHRGPLADALVVIVDIVDQNRALVDWSVDGGEYFERQQIGLKMLNLTDITLDIGTCFQHERWLHRC